MLAIKFSYQQIPPVHQHKDQDIKRQRYITGGSSIKLILIRIEATTKSMTKKSRKSISNAVFSSLITNAGMLTRGIHAGTSSKNVK